MLRLLVASVLVARASGSPCTTAQAALASACPSDAIGTYDTFTGYAAFCEETTCLQALKEVHFYCPSPCAGVESDHDTQQGYRDYAKARLEFCDACSTEAEAQTLLAALTLTVHGSSPFFFLDHLTEKFC